MCLVLAADSWQRAVMEGRLRSLCWAGAWVGLGFQAKMLQAWMILPALGLGYLGGPGGLGARGGSETAKIDAWVRSSCQAVQGSGAESTGTLYQCGTR
jgi:dolichyl-phosphate-mannose-protein mannosyltransferase